MPAVAYIRDNDFCSLRKLHRFAYSERGATDIEVTLATTLSLDNNPLLWSCSPNHTSTFAFRCILIPRTPRHSSICVRPLRVVLGLGSDSRTWVTLLVAKDRLCTGVGVN